MVESVIKSSSIHETVYPIDSKGIHCVDEVFHFQQDGTIMLECVYIVDNLSAYFKLTPDGQLSRAEEKDYGDKSNITDIYPLNSNYLFVEYRNQGKIFSWNGTLVQRTRLNQNITPIFGLKKLKLEGNLSSYPRSDSSFATTEGGFGYCVLKYDITYESGQSDLDTSTALWGENLHTLNKQFTLSDQFGNQTDLWNTSSDAFWTILKDNTFLAATLGKNNIKIYAMNLPHFFKKRKKEKFQVNVIVDIIFVVNNEKDVRDLYLSSGLAMYIVITEITINGEYVLWLRKHAKPAALFTLLSAADIDALNLFYSKYTNFDLFNAPISKRVEDLIFWGSGANIFIEDIPQFII
ncbi:hypothetical protein G9A89_001245 [Geosiphon pyriformis]|nr:hypothetical protein G9A89_001245 [Geosiphon pyriformis]